VSTHWGDIFIILKASKDVILQETFNFEFLPIFLSLLSHIHVDPKNRYRYL